MHLYKLVVLILALFAARPALAYLDPASGSMFLQLLLGGIAGAALFFKLAWHKIVDLVRPASRVEDGEQHGAE